MIKYSSLQQKDVDYMNFILRNGIVTAKQLFLNFEEKNMDAVYRRLRKLKGRGYVKHHTIAHKVGVFTGTNEARNATEAKVTLTDGPSIYTIRHTLLMTDLVLYYQLGAKQKGWKFSYKTEREIRFEALQKADAGKMMIEKINEIKERFPDCTFEIGPAEHIIKAWVELELHQKDNKRYKAKFKERFDPALKTGEYDEVWYFTDTERIRKAVNKVKLSLSSPQKLKVYDIPGVIKHDNWEVLMNGIGNGQPKGEGEIRSRD